MEISSMSALMWFAIVTAVGHTIAGPDHYLPFIMIAKAQKHSWGKAALLTLVCGIGHIASALVIALVFNAGISYIATDLQAHVEDVQSSIAAYVLIGFGLAYLAWALRHRFLRRHQKSFQENSPVARPGITPWILFIIFVLGPCEALWPVLLAAQFGGTSAMISATIVFSLATIATMLAVVTVGVLGLNKFKFNFVEKYAHELAGSLIMACGVAMICGL